MAITRETILERRQPQLRWSAVFGGAAVTIGLWITLQILGMGIGLASVHTDDTGNLRSAGIGTGIWSLIAPLIAMFLGGMLAGRLATTRERKVGAMHGAVMWALALAFGLWVLASTVGALVSGVAKVGGAAASAAETATSSVVGGLDMSDLLQPINERLAREGKPQITEEQLTATLRGVAQHGMKNGKLDRNVLAQELVKNTNLTPADAQDIASRMGDRYEQLASQVQEVGGKAKHAALEAADRTGKALALGGLMMLLALGASVGGGALGVRRREEESERTTRPPTVVVPPSYPPES